MVDIVDRSRFATAGAMCDIYHIARSVLQQIGEGHRIAGYAQEASTSHTPSSRPPVSSTPSRMQPIRGRGRGRGRGGVERRVHAGDGGAGHGVDSDSGTCTLDASLTTLLPSHTYLSPSTPQSLPPHIEPSPSTPHSVSPHIDSLPSIPPHIDTSPSIPPHDDTILDPLPEWVDFQVGGLGLDVCIDYFIHHLPRLHQLSRRRLTQHRILLPYILFILGAVLRELLRRLLVGLIDT